MAGEGEVVGAGEVAGEGEVDDAFYGDRVDRTFLVGGKFGKDSWSENASVLVGIEGCGVVWAIRWQSMTDEMRDAVEGRGLEAEGLWRAGEGWTDVEKEWWGENTGRKAGVVRAALGETGAKLEHSVSIVAACKDRPDTLAVAATSWTRVEGVSEIVLMDWSSAAPLRAVLPPTVLADERVFIATAPGQSAWVLTRAYNIAIRLATSAAVLKVDCDTVLSPDFLTTHPLIPGVFYAGDWRVLTLVSDSSSSAPFVADEQVHVNGLLYAPRHDWIRVGGYDERIATYGWDDSDIASRMARVSESRAFNYSLVRHLAHDDNLRTATQRRSSILPPDNPLAAAVEIQRNRILLTRFGLAPWSASSPRIRWNVASTPEGLVVTAASAIPAVAELVPAEDALDVSKRSIRLILLRYGISLLPKTLSLDFYKLLATHAGFPQHAADLVLQLHGGCASRILAVAASHTVTIGSSPVALQATAAVATKPKPGEQTVGEDEGSGETVNPPALFSSWRLRFVWRQPDVSCSCRFNNVYEVPDVEILSTAPDLARNETLELDSSTAEDGSEQAESINSTDVRSLLESVIALPGKRTFTATLSGDVRPVSASTAHTKAVRSFLRTLLPTKATHTRIMDSLRSKHPSALDDAELLPEALPALLGVTAAANLLATFAKSDVHAMASAWGATSRAQVHIEHQLDRRAVAVTAAMIARSGRGTGSENDGEMREEENANVKGIVGQVLSMFDGSPGAPEEYLLAYPEMAVLVAASLAGDVCAAGVQATRQFE